MQIDCTKTHCQRADKTTGKNWVGEKILKNKRMQAATCQGVGGAVSVGTYEADLACVEGRGLMQITSEAAAQMLRKFPARGISPVTRPTRRCNA